jgi:HSP20 family protein
MVSRMMTPFGGRGLMNRGDPFLDLHREMNRLFDDTFRGMGGGSPGQGTMMGIPRLDVHEAGEQLEISAELPGVKQENVDIELEGDILTISGEKRQDHEDKKAHFVERSYGSFSRSIQLPFQPDPDQVNADFENGVLRITLPRQGSKDRSRRIQIGHGKGQRTIEGGATQNSGQVSAASSGQSGGDDDSATSSQAT